LRTVSGRRDLPGGEQIWKRYAAFSRDLPRVCGRMRIRPEEMTFVDYATAVAEWPPARK